MSTLVEIIKQAARPEQVILFGSRATGTAHPESDYDFLVVVREVESERLISRSIYRALMKQRVGVAVDIVVVSADKLDKHREPPGFIYRRALQEGEVCYKRPRVSTELAHRKVPGTFCTHSQPQI